MIKHKSKGKAKWLGLSPQQRVALETWLFEDGLTYDEALAEAKKQFGFQGSVSSLKRFYRRMAEERLLTTTVEAAATKPGISESEARATGMQAVGRLFVQQVRENPDEVKEWWLLAKLLLQSQENELRERLQDDDHELRRQYLCLAQARFQWNAVEDAEKALPEINELAQKRKDPKVRKYEFNRFMNAVRRKLFGSAPDRAPESEEEEARIDEIHARDREEAAWRGAFACLELRRKLEAEGKSKEYIIDLMGRPSYLWAEKAAEREAKCGTRNAECGMGEPKGVEKGPGRTNGHLTPSFARKGGEGDGKAKEADVSGEAPNTAPEAGALPEISRERVSREGNGNVSTTDDTDFTDENK